MRAGRALRAQQAILNAPPCAGCGHKEAHRELAPTLALVDGVIVETPDPAYVALVFHCTAAGCDCTIDRRPVTKFVVQVYSRGRWAKVRGNEGGPWNTRQRAERIAELRQAVEPVGLSSTEGLPHRVVEVEA